jgi:peptidyl-prolyl cis-trans isomerase SurA
MLIRSTLLALLVFDFVAVCASELLDRIVATVNGHVILLSDVDDELRYEYFVSGRKLEKASADDQKAALDRLIDQQLLREQIRVADTKAAGTEQTDKQLSAIKADVLRDNPGDSWQQVLAKYRLNENIVRTRIAPELQQLQLIDARFRPSIQVSQAEIEQYYKDQLVPKLPPSDPVSLADVTPKIREILVQNKMDQMLNSWLESLRSQAQIKRVDANLNGSSTPPQVGPQ